MSNVPYNGTLCTGNTVSVPLVRYSFFAPSDLWIQEAIFGMIWDLANPDKWTLCGMITPAEAALAFTNLWESLKMDFMQVGAVILWAGPIPAGGALLYCDGTSYLRADYPDLFAVIGTTFGSVDSTHFNVPDLRGRVPVGDGTGSGLTPRTIGDTGGEEAHSLTSAENGPHAHAYSGPGVPVAATPGVLPVDGVPSIPSFTGTDGAGTSHNNMQPFLVMSYAIIAQ